MASARRNFSVLLALLNLTAQALPALGQSGRPVTRILLLFGHDPNSPGAGAFAHELRGVLQSEWPRQVEVYDEVLDFDRFGDRETWPRVAANLTDKYRSVRIDAVVAEGSMALQFAAEKFGKVFPDVPIVYGNVFEPV